MKRKVAKLRLSPNEEAQLLREEHERRRKLRIQQVREQQRFISLQIRQNVEERRRRELEQLEEELRMDWEQQQKEKLQTLQRLYHESLQLLGQGHRSAKENEPDMAAIAQREEENHSRAEQRYREALKELKSQRLKDYERQSRSIEARKKALQAEKERSAKVSSLPPPPADPIQTIADSRKPHVVKKSDVSAFASTHYHMSETAVDRELHTQQSNACEGAEQEARRLQELQREEARRRQEQLEKARLRGKQALRREQLTQDRERLLVELEHMQQTDLLRRRQQVSLMPPQIFQPLYKRQEMREDFQREMEFAFEDMYTGEKRVKGDLVVQLVPEPLPALSTGSQDQDLDVTVDEDATPQTQSSEQAAGNTEEETSAHAGLSRPAPRPAPRQALRKLLDRIRNQRNQWTDHSSRDAAPESPTVTTDQIPERDTTIDTGSLTSGDRDEPVDSAPSSPALETTEQAAAAETHLPDQLTNRIQEFEAERKKREVELELEKQQQMVLLEELEEQKKKLEQLLLEAQQEREDLKAAVTQEEEPVQDQEVSVHPPDQVQDQEVTHSPELFPAAETDHTRRIREYQQRLLEQNRLHRRSVEVARQRLEEYQRALRIRYNMAATSLPPAVLLPPGLIHPHPVHLPTPLHLTTTPDVPGHTPVQHEAPEEVPTRGSPPPLPADSRLLPDEVEPASNGFMNPLQDAAARLTGSIMERVTQHLPERLRPSPVTIQHSTSNYPDPIQAVSLDVPDDARHDPGTSLRGDDMESQRREIQDVRRQLLEQREVVELQQRIQEKERQRQEERWRRQEEEMEQMRRQKEALEALIDADAQSPQSAPEVSGEDLAPENIGQTRLELLASLLRAIEESNGGSLSQLENHQETGDSPQQLPSTSCTRDPDEAPSQTSVLSGLVPPRAVKPPLTRVRLGLMETTEQHELSAIQEVETPVNSSHVTGPEDFVKASTQTPDVDLQEDSDSSGSSQRILQSSLSVMSSELQTTSSESSSTRSSYLTWRERLLTGAGTAPQSSESDSVQKTLSPLSSDSGRGADFSGPGISSYKSFTESAHRQSPGSDHLSSTTISTGSYVTTDPDQNFHTDESLHHRPPLEDVGEASHLQDVSSPCGSTSCVKDVSSPCGSTSSVKDVSAAAVDSLFNDSSIQRIIDRYTRELNISLSSAGKTTDESVEDEQSSSVSQQTLVQSPERREDEEAAAERRSLDQDQTVDPVLVHVSAEDQDQSSFRPLIGQLADESSCLAADQRDWSLQQLVGQPSPPPASVDPGSWDSTLSRMIGRLSRPSSSHWLSGGRDFYAAQLIAQMEAERSVSWLDDGGGETSGMRPLVGELDDTTGQNDGSSVSGETTRVDLDDVPSHLATTSPEASATDSVPAGTPHPQDQNLPGPVDLDPDRTGGSDSFHPLVAELTHNETCDPSMMFHLPQHDSSMSPEAHPASVSHPEQSETSSVDPSLDSESSPERFRSEEKMWTSSAALQESSSQLLLYQHLPQESQLTVSPMAQDVEKTTWSLSLNPLQPAEEESDTSCSSETCTGSVLELKTEQVLNLRKEDPVRDQISDSGGVKGILEQSEITLVSITDTTLDPDSNVSEDDGVTWEEGQKGQGSEEPESTLTEEAAAALKGEEDQTPPGTLLEVQWGSSSSSSRQDVHQQKIRALIQRSSHRVDQIKARGAQRRTQGPPETTTQAKAKEAGPVKKKPEPQDLHRNLKSHGGGTSGGTSEKPGSMKQKRPPRPPPVVDSRPMTGDDLKMCDPEQRRRDVSEMYKRTQRLYQQLEEVKHQKELRSRREENTRNRLKAKEFHKRTLQKLRAKPTK